ncbi:SAM-dependent methyltransferase [Pigmentiphaga litoralis]|uniref:class I SAM-dependent methyltransferase n=1 Tax=Pigmentiphaga litoralis TaxID=516702 RepID=UPI001676F90B|nr:class I SAM-dependent methyltransferase [Pigmentiphaga litoralis]GGX18025.1 SAM-dependent methyltransferase [Pigmentiphaga litoralis]
MNANEFYEENAELFISQTRDADMSAAYAEFVRRLPAGGSILDAGSGSGRDSAWFKAHGFKVEAFDSSPAMVQATESFADVPTRLIRFEEFEWEHPFDGIWACASLLHVARSSFSGVINRLASALNDEGSIYCSFKLGTQERVLNGRYFNDFDERLLVEALSHTRTYAAAMWRTNDVRPDRANENWLNALLSKRRAPTKSALAANHL